MTTENNKKLARRHYEEVLTQKHIDLIDELYADNIKVGDSSSMPRSQFKSLAQMTTSIFPDLVVVVQDQIAEGDKVVSRWTATGTQQGDFMGIPATGKVVAFKAIHIHQIVNGRIAALWEEFDMFGLMQQLNAPGT